MPSAGRCDTLMDYGLGNHGILVCGILYTISIPTSLCQSVCVACPGACVAYIKKLQFRLSNVCNKLKTFNKASGMHIIIALVV